MNHSNIVVGFALLLSGVKSRFFPSERTVASSYFSGYPKIKRIIFRYMIETVYNFASSVICISDSVSNDLRRNFSVRSEKLVTIYNPIVHEGIFDLSNESVECDWLSNESIFCVVTAGRLHKDKDFPTLLKAFCELSRRTDSRLLLLGEGEEKQSLESLADSLGISDKIRFLGFQSNPYKYFSKAGAFVLPSKYEGFGNVIAEAMACGTTVIAKRGSGGPDEIINSADAGYLFDDCEELLRILHSVSEDSGSRRNGKTRAQDFSVGQIAREYISVMKEIPAIGE